VHPVMADRMWYCGHTRTVLNYIGGLAGGFVASTVGFPLDVLRTRLLFGGQLHGNFFNGFLFTFPYTILKTGLVWPLQRNIKQLCEERVSGFGGTLLSGTIGNALPGVLLNPLNIIKVRLMESHDPKKVREVVKQIITTEGKEAFRRGLCATLTRDALWGMLYFPLFEFHQRHLTPHISSRNTEQHSLLQLVTASVSAASMSTLCTSVIDSMRMYQMKSLSEHRGWRDAWRISIKPTHLNILATMSGVSRVAITTALGHVSYLKLFEEERD